MAEHPIYLLALYLFGSLLVPVIVIGGLAFILYLLTRRLS